MNDSYRESAFKIIYEVNENGAYSNILLNKFFAGKRFQTITDEIDKNKIIRTVYGTIQNLIKIDMIIKNNSSIKLKNISKSVLNILRMAIYELLYMDSIPDYAVINESVDMCKEYANKRAAGFVNGLLRGIVRNNSLKTPKGDMSQEYSFPEFIINIIKKQIGVEETEKYLAYTHKKPELFIRVNTLKTKKEELLKKLLKEGFEPEETDIHERAIKINKPSGLFKSKLFTEGLFSVQDPGAMMAVDELGIKPGEIVLDLCAAPGGKTCYAAEIMKNTGSVYAFDIHEHKIKLINEQAERLGLDIIKAEIKDAKISDKKYIGYADKIIADVPCSGLGVISRKPEIKNRLKGEDIDSLILLQAEILKNASGYLKKGGRLLYCTCTLNKKENENIVNSFLKENSSFRLVKEPGLLVPHISGTDGFFTAVMEKCENG
jgi:16S rRNA (cytosine967-C5)-methyltransferase